MLLSRQNPMVIMVFIHIKPLWQTFCIQCISIFFFLRTLLKETWIFWVKGVTFFLHPHLLKSWTCFFMHWYLSRKMVHYLFNTSFWNIFNLPLFTVFIFYIRSMDRWSIMHNWLQVQSKEETICQGAPQVSPEATMQCDTWWRWHYWRGLRYVWTCEVWNKGEFYYLRMILLIINNNDTNNN